MIAKFGLAILAFAMQYLLLHSHKAGYGSWIWIASANALLLAVAALGLQVADEKWRPWLLATSATVSLVLPPAIYVTREWTISPKGVSNALANDTWFYLTSITIVSGGWLFAILLLWLRGRSSKGMPA